MLASLKPKSLTLAIFDAASFPGSFPSPGSQGYSHRNGTFFFFERFKPTKEVRAPSSFGSKRGEGQGCRRPTWTRRLPAEDVGPSMFARDCLDLVIRFVFFLPLLC